MIQMAPGCNVTIAERLDMSGIRAISSKSVPNVTSLVIPLLIVASSSKKWPLFMPK